MFYVYILKSKVDGNFYIGYTSDLKKRFREHNEGKVPSTRPRRPMILVFYEAFNNSTDAQRREKYFKTSKGRSSLRQIIRNS